MRRRRNETKGNAREENGLSRVATLLEAIPIRNQYGLYIAHVGK